jgi:hypothetical protein
MKEEFLQKIHRKSASFAMSNGHVIHMVFRYSICSATNRRFLAGKEMETGASVILAEDDISYIRLMPDLPAGQSRETPGLETEGFGSFHGEVVAEDAPPPPPALPDGPYADRIRRAKAKYRTTEFVSRHPESDGLEAAPRYRPKIEGGREVDDNDQEG